MDFKQDVIERSNSIPVVVDFWAPWCGPCKFLGPVIEDLAGKANGKWELVKVNSDENPDLSTEYGIRGIPAVKMFLNEKVIAEFTGALPKHQIEDWLEENIPDERKNELADILADEEVVKKLREFIKVNPDFDEAKAELAIRILLTDPDESSKLVADFRPGNKFYSVVESVEVINNLRNCNMDDNPVLEGKIKKANESLENKDIEAAIEALIEGVILDKSYCNELLRKSAIAIFNVLGSDHNLTKKYRRKFDMALY